MNVSYKWLKEYVDFDLTPQETADALTSCGLEVGALEEVQSVKGGLKGLYVGKVLTCEEHPNSDHLHVTTVDLGKGEPQQIVCGAPNVAAGQKVIVADLSNGTQSSMGLTYANLYGAINLFTSPNFFAFATTSSKYLSRRHHRTP